MVDDVIVIAKVKRDGGAVSYTTLNSRSAVGSQYGNNFSDWKDSADSATSAVSIEVTDATKLPEAKTAAQNIARVLTRIEADLDALPPGTPVTWHGNTLTAKAVLDIIHATTFIVSDRSNNGNSGVGAANSVNHTDTLYYEAFDGDGGDYASPNYVNDAGLVGILFHEIGHLSAPGASFDGDSRAFYQKEHHSFSGYIGSDYFKNNEKFANDFAYSAASAFGENLAGLNLTYGRNAHDPEQI